MDKEPVDLISEEEKQLRQEQREKNRESAENLVLRKAIQIGSSVMIATELDELVRISIAMSLLSIASNMKDSNSANRLISIANKVKEK